MESFSLWSYFAGIITGFFFTCAMGVIAIFMISHEPAPEDDFDCWNKEDK